MMLENWRMGIFIAGIVGLLALLFWLLLLVTGIVHLIFPRSKRAIVAYLILSLIPGIMTLIWALMNYPGRHLSNPSVADPYYAFVYFGVGGSLLLIAIGFLAIYRLSKKEITPKTEPSLDVEFSGLAKRIIAFIIDYMILLISLLVLINLSNRIFQNIFSSSETGVLQDILIMIVMWSYFTIFESSIHQGTPGKILFKMKVIDYSGDRLTRLRALRRTFFKIVIVGTVGFGFLTAVFTKEKQGLHDMLGKTYVVNKSVG